MNPSQLTRSKSCGGPKKEARLKSYKAESSSAPKRKATARRKPKESRQSERQKLMKGGLQNQEHSFSRTERKRKRRGARQNAIGKIAACAAASGTEPA